jgi:hypothetical protein
MTFIIPHSEESMFEFKKKSVSIVLISYLHASFARNELP